MSQKEHDRKSNEEKVRKHLDLTVLPTKIVDLWSPKLGPCSCLGLDDAEDLQRAIGCAWPLAQSGVRSL